MGTRIHKVVLHPNGTNHFSKLTAADGKPVDVHAATARTNPSWPSYEGDEICLDMHALYPQGDVIDGLPMLLVLRLNVQCACAGHCGFPADHAQTVATAWARIPQARPPVIGQPRTKHGRGRGFVEGHLERNNLRALKAAAESAISEGKERAALAALISAEAAKWELSANELQGALADQLSLPNAVAPVLAGTSMVADDYYWCSAFLHAWRDAIHQVHLEISLRWPQLPTGTESRLGTAGGAQ